MLLPTYHHNYCYSKDFICTLCKPKPGIKNLVEEEDKGAISENTDGDNNTIRKGVSISIAMLIHASS